MDGSGVYMDDIRIMNEGQATMRRADGLRLGYLYGGSVRYQPGENLGPRRLTDIELVLIMEGRADYEVRGEGYPLEPGSIVLARPGFRECYLWDREGRSRHAYFHFGIDAIPGAWPGPENWPVSRRRPDPAVSGLFRSVLERSHRRGDSPSAAQPELDCHLVETLIELLIEEPDPSGVLEDIERPEPVARALKRMRYVMEEEAERMVTLPELSKHAGVSNKHLCRVFRQSIGHPPMETFRLLRLQLAVALLVRSSLAVKEVAAQCGFADPLHFSRCFSAAFGRSPRRVREDLKLGIAPPPNPLPVDVTPRVHW